MKIITLNVWGGKLHKDLIKFLLNKKEEIDIFCFQEVFNNFKGLSEDYINHNESDINTLSTIKNCLDQYDYYFCPVDESGVYGTAIFIKNNLRVLDSGSIIIYNNPDFDPSNDLNDHNRKLQWIIFQDEYKNNVLVANVHGHWEPEGKEDSIDRIKQSKIIAELVLSNKEIKRIILCGDFNLMPNTESIKIIEKTGLKNLIKEKNITSTRTSYCTKPEKFADYAFVSKDINIKNFEVLPDEVSDHSPLCLEFN